MATRLPGASGARQGRCGNGDSLHLLAVGDSIIDGVGTRQTDESLPVCYARELARETGRAVHWRIEGLSGWAIGEVNRHLEGLDVAEAPDQLLVSVGVNDVTGFSTTSQWRKGLHRFLNISADRWPRARILFCGLPPMQLFPLLPQPLRATLGYRAAALDQIAAEEMGKTPRAQHVKTRIDPANHDFCEDGFHPSAESCNLWAAELIRVQQGDH